VCQNITHLWQEKDTLGVEKKNKNIIQRGRIWHLPHSQQQVFHHRLQGVEFSVVLSNQSIGF